MQRLESGRVHFFTLRAWNSAAGYSSRWRSSRGEHQFPLFQRQHNPIHSAGISRAPVEAGSHREAAKIATIDSMGCLPGQRFWMQAGVGEHRRAFREIAKGGGAELIGLRHGTSGAVGLREIKAGQRRTASLLARLVDGEGNPVLHFSRGIGGEDVAEILHDVQALSAPNHTQPDHVVGRVEQVRAMRGGRA